MKQTLNNYRTRLVVGAAFPEPFRKQSPTGVGIRNHATIAGKEDKNKKIKSKSNEPSTAEPAS